MQFPEALEDNSVRKINSSVKKNIFYLLQTLHPGLAYIGTKLGRFHGNDVSGCIQQLILKLNEN